MKTESNVKTFIPAIIGLVILILDSKTALEGAQTGIRVCFNTVLPSLFPFIYLSSLLTTSLLAGHFKGTRILCKLYGIPIGAEGILLTGLLGGYPVGARCIGQAVHEGQLSSSEGERMLIFCNAAGPAFLFGIAGSIFQQRWIPWCLWGIHLFSGLCMAKLSPSSSGRKIRKSSVSVSSMTQHLRKSLKVMGEICGWIILMRIVIAFAEKWCFRHFSGPLTIFISGLLELTNGCISLHLVENTGLRFLLIAVLLGFGGLCVALQTASVASAVKQRMYLPGKCVQATISFAAAYIVQLLFLNEDQKIHLPLLFTTAVTVLVGVIIYSHVNKKKSCGNLLSVVV